MTKLRWTMIIGLVAAGALCALILWPSGNRERRAVEETRLALRQQGFKTDVTEFNFSTSPELRARAAALTSADLIGGGVRGTDYAGWAMLRQALPNSMSTVGPGAALVVWQQDELPSRFGEASWPALREILGTNRAPLDAACEAALSGPIRFELVASHGSSMLLPHLARLRGLAQTLGMRGMLELHDHNKAAAWTNLLAATRVVTGWEPEPVEVSQMVWYGCAGLVYNATWQTLQAGGWADDRLAQLQHEWESVDFFRALPETAAFTRASMVATCQLERQQPVSLPGLTIRNLLRSPRSLWDGPVYYWRQLHYRHHGSYEDEKALLLHYRDRELQVRRALQCSTWAEMRQLPGVTNAAPFRSKYPSRFVSMINLRQVSLSMTGGRQGLLAGAAEAEGRRRVIITALALERYRGRHGLYPKALSDLVPELLKTLLPDFMDGQPLRYHCTDDGHFVLYSVGLDCVDNGGEMRRLRRRGTPFDGSGGRLNPREEIDLVWPRPATAAEVQLARQAEKQAEAQQTDRMEEAQATAEWRRTARRQAKVETILKTRPRPAANEPLYRGRPLSEVLRNENTAGTNTLTLDDMLKLKQVLTGAEPEVAAFELPVKYGVLTNLGSLHLYIDPVEDEDSDEGCNVGQLDCRAATNGNCILVWNTIYDAPGKHALQAGLILNEAAESDVDITGPLTPFVVSNLCQFCLSSAYFNPAIGANFRARLPESHGTYLIELKSPIGERLKTISGSTSNGILKVHWDLTDDHGNTCTNGSYDSVLHLILPDSGRSQTLKGP